jgi:hypothetical protein
MSVRRLLIAAAAVALLGIAADYRTAEPDPRRTRLRRRARRSS